MVTELNRLRPRSFSRPIMFFTVTVVIALCTLIYRKPMLVGVESGSLQQTYWMAGVIAGGLIFLIIRGVYNF